MKKIAVFVEGQTELIFMCSLLKAVFGENHIALELRQLVGKAERDVPSRIRILATYPSESTQYYFTVFDCHGGGEKSAVKSEIRDRAERLAEKDYAMIFGLRDLFPLPDLEKLRTNMVLDHLPLPARIFIAVREIEGWFLAEDHHYAKLSPELTIAKVNEIAGIDITHDSTEQIEHPSETLKAIYHTVGIEYKKKASDVLEITDTFDYDNLYFTVRNRNHSLNEMLEYLDGIMEERNENG